MNENRELYMDVLRNIRDYFEAGYEAAVFDDMIRLGWIRPAAAIGGEDGRAYIANHRAKSWYDGFDKTWMYVLTGDGMRMLAQMSNCEPVRLRLVCPGIAIPVVGEISRQDAPNFDFSHKKGLHVCWGMHKRVTPLHEDIPRLRYLYRYSVDSETIVALGKYLVEAVGYMGQSPWDVGREARA